MAEEIYNSWETLFAELYERSGGDSSALDSWDNEAQLAALFEHFQVPEDRYEIGETLGRGGWKEVFKAFDKHSGREVAYAQPSDPSSTDVVEAFLREARIIARLQHPSIISLYSLGISKEGVPFYAMETELGGSFHTLLKKGQISPEQSLEIYLQVCNAIAYAHLVGIVHLDLKPENIQIGSHGVVKVCDWGLSATIQPVSDENRVVTGFFDLCGDNGDFSRSAGTRGYIAPERKTRRTPAAPAADIFALGVILQEISKLFPRPSRRRLAAIAARASAEAPENRYGSVEALQADLKSFQSQLPTSVEPGGLFSRLRLFVLRNQLPITYATASCAFLAVLSAFFLVHSERAKRQIDRALSGEERAYELQLLAETEAQDEYSKRVKEAYDQSIVLLDLIVLNPSLSEQSVSDSIDLLTEVVDSSDDDATSQLARGQLGTSYFIAQRFDEAVDAFLGTEVKENLEEIAARFAKSPKEGKILAAEDFIALLKAMPKEELLLQEKMVFYDRAIRRNWNDEVNIALAWLDNKNPSWSAQWSKWSEEDKSLTLKGKGLEDFTETPEKFSSFRKNILFGLGLSILRFEKTGFHGYGQLTGLHLKTLDLSKEAKPPQKS